MRSLLIATALAAAVLGVYRLAPLFGGLIAIFVTPVVIHWAITISREQAMGKMLAFNNVVIRFGQSLGLIWLLAIVYGFASYVALMLIAVPAIFLTAVFSITNPPLEMMLHDALPLGVALGAILQLTFSIGFLVWRLSDDRTTNQNRLGDMGFMSAWVVVSTTTILLFESYWRLQLSTLRCLGFFGQFSLLFWTVQEYLFYVQNFPKRQSDSAW